MWLALPVACDWRWLRGRDDSPWYPTLRLFRQRQWGDWDDVFRRIADAVQERLSASSARSIVVETSAGEFIDKLSILEIKHERIGDEGQRANVLRELEALRAVYGRLVAETEEVRRLKEELREVNELLWRTEDDIRLCEREGDFGPRFVELARSVYQQNDRRAALKRALTRAWLAVEGGEGVRILRSGQRRNLKCRSRMQREGGRCRRLQRGRVQTVARRPGKSLRAEIVLDMGLQAHSNHQKGRTRFGDRC